MTFQHQVTIAASLGVGVVEVVNGMTPFWIVLSCSGVAFVAYILTEES